MEEALPRDQPDERVRVWAGSWADWITVGPLVALMSAITASP